MIICFVVVVIGGISGGVRSGARWGRRSYRLADTSAGAVPEAAGVIVTC